VYSEFTISTLVHGEDRGKNQKITLAPATVLLPASHPIQMAEEYALL
jgi:hypothetical protein